MWDFDLTSLYHLGGGGQENWLAIVFYQAKPKLNTNIHKLSNPQREKALGHLVPTADGTCKLGHTISKKKN